jgi:aldose 1-epimerase
MALEQVTLTDAATGSTATVLVGFGFNCYRFIANVGEPVDVLWSAPGFENGTERPSHSGIPLLFPYPGRLRGTTLAYGGKTYDLAGNDGRGNAIHGYALNRPWKVVEQSPSRIVGEFQASERDPSILKQWPADFRLIVSYELRGTSLHSTVTIENPDDKPLPYGFGSHPYFRVPLGTQGSADDCTVMVPAAKYWELVDMLPSGKKLPAVGSHGLLHGMRFGDTKLDDIFTDLVFEAGRGRATITDSSNKRRLEMRFDDRFTECVVYNPPHRQAICMEPYTCSPDQFTMAERGVISAPQTLPPGGKWSAAYEIRLNAIS